MDADEPGICKTCGLFGKQTLQRRSPSSQAVLHVQQSERDAAQLEIPGSQYDARAICFAGIELRFDELVAELNNNERATKAILYETRGANGCPRWIPYKPNLDPKWHLEDFRMLQLERERQEFESRLAASERSFRRFLAAITVIALVLTFLQVAVAMDWIGDSSHQTIIEQIIVRVPEITGSDLARPP